MGTRFYPDIKFFNGRQDIKNCLMSSRYPIAVITDEDYTIFEGEDLYIKLGFSIDFSNIHSQIETYVVPTCASSYYGINIDYFLHYTPEGEFIVKVSCIHPKYDGFKLVTPNYTEYEKAYSNLYPTKLFYTPAKYTTIPKGVMIAHINVEPPRDTRIVVPNEGFKRYTKSDINKIKYC